MGEPFHHRMAHSTTMWGSESFHPYCSGSLWGALVVVVGVATEVAFGPVGLEPFATPTHVTPLRTADSPTCRRTV